MSLSKRYSTLELIEDLRKEISKFSQTLSKIFPERLKKFSQAKFSIFWKNDKYYIARLKQKITYPKRRGFNPQFRLYEKDIYELKEKIALKLGYFPKEVNSQFDIYMLNHNSTIEFIEQVRNLLSKYWIIEVSDTELGILLTGNANTIEKIRSRITNTKNQNFNPNYLFSKERLVFIQNNIKNIFNKDSKSITSYINKYTELNPCIKEYSNQKLTINKPHFFKTIDSEEKAYWFGWMSSDGYVHENQYKVSLEIAVKDKEVLYRFAKSIGFPLKRIKERIRIYSYKGELKNSTLAYIQFVCKPMSEDLLKHGLYVSLKPKIKAVPHFITKNTSFKIKFAWLLGLYDGDGEFRENRSGRITSKNKDFLLKIKEVFAVPYHVHKIKCKEMEIFDGKLYTGLKYTLHLGRSQFIPMIKSYNNSLLRKRPKNKK